MQVDDLQGFLLCVAVSPTAQGIDEKSIRVVQARNGTWEARVRRQGGKVLLKSFPTKTLASVWAEEREGEIAKGAFVDTKLADKTTVRDPELKRGLKPASATLQSNFHPLEEPCEFKG